ncbi:MAG: glycoside hydrolase family 25 protein [Saprospirales bacterium]|nr:glycoside hydrolase family 25 protein [Saprospirales bacterium]
MSWLNKLLIFPPGYGRQSARRGKGLWPALLVLVGIMLWISPELRYRLFTLFDYPFHYKEYKHFGIRIPNGYDVHGIDVSRYQSRVDWERVAGMKIGQVRISFAFMKASEGSWMKDPWFDYNWKNASKHGIIRGAYHYFLPNVSPKSQARHFARTAPLRPGDLPPVVDIEETRGMTKPQIRKFTKAFLVLLQNEFGVKPIVYTNRDFYKNHFAGVPEFKPYCFWIAHYHVANLDMPDGSRWHFWQHSDRGSVNGINERVDFNVFYADSAALRRMCLP